MHHQFDLQTGESVRLGDFKVTLLDVENGSAVFEIEGPDGEVSTEPVSPCFADSEENEELALA